jgi:hypothetical protein
MHYATKTRILVKTLTSAAALTAVVGLSQTARAEAKTHDGFYMQIAGGVGYLSSSAELGPSNLTLSGVTTPLHLLLGGTAGPIVIGGGFFFDHAASPSASISGSSVALTDVSMTLVGIGAFADYYVDPHGGLHFQPFVGWGALESSRNGNSGGSDPTGLVLALGGGYDWWVGDEWSIGVMGRLAYAPLSYSAGGASVSYSTIAPALLATFTYH